MAAPLPSLEWKRANPSPQAGVAIRHDPTYLYLTVEARSLTHLAGLLEG